MTSSIQLVSNFLNWRDLAKILKPGDLIEFKRGDSSSTGCSIYQHWAVYVGLIKGVHHVVHYSNEDLSNSARRTFGNFLEIIGNVEVQLDVLENVACNCSCRKNNSRDAVDPPINPEEIVDTAKKSVGQSGYNILTNNCEHFAHFCRYGKRRSRQANNTVRWIGGAAIVGGIAVGAAVAVTLLSTNDKQKDKQAEKK
ncbi:hypothetical protein PMAYCL1PPCAC_08916 [Pristionchus mayeri]|uniref:LRAT domain-containing protein n=1 Tax=Pristionchus mayeri TaxID=1317129 RepID=A0AAN5CEF3_9BILA|nr:hypothetical protein PMAYCL1PPCAC_08916 [Pristionchus mayeri]